MSGKEIQRIYQGDPMPVTPSNRWVALEAHEQSLVEAHRRGAIEAIAAADAMLKQIGQEYEDGKLDATEGTYPIWIALVRLISVRERYEAAPERKEEDI